MCRLTSAELDAGNSAPLAARRWIDVLLEHWELSALSDAAKLLTSEMVTNAIRHTRSGPTVTASVADGFLEIGVTDGDALRMPQQSTAQDPWAAGGRGLILMEEFSDEWGIAVLPEGKQVWVQVEIADWPYRPTCRCLGDDTENSTVGSEDGPCQLGPMGWRRSVPVSVTPSFSGHSNVIPLPG
jgi:anti-sigma regulatory factor (Ser/Thr protein kinase)